MQGTILGFSDDSGAISGEDGARYNFNRHAWRGDTDPRPQDRVDFVVGDDGLALEIYPLRRASALGDLGTVFGRGGESLSRLASSDGSQEALARLKAKPALVLAALVVLVSIVLPYITLSLVEEDSSSLVSFSLFGSSQLGDLADFARERAENTWFMAEDDRNVLRGVAFMLDALAWLALTLLVVPACAGWVLFDALKGKSTRTAEILTVVGIAWAMVYWLFAREALAQITDGLGGFMSGDALREAWALGFGSYLLILLAVGLALDVRGFWAKRFKQA